MTISSSDMLSMLVMWLVGVHKTSGHWSVHKTSGCGSWEWSVGSGFFYFGKEHLGVRF